jgi:hypothetical protein
MSKFTIIYPYNDEARNAIFGKLVFWSKSVDLENQGINGGTFKIVKNWPTQNILKDLPMNVQVEEVLLENDKIISLRRLTIDAEIVPNKKKPNPIILEEIAKELPKLGEVSEQKESVLP